jgi:hypothetical protein
MTAPLSPEIVKLITALILALAIPHVRAKAVDGIIRFLDHPDSNVVSACLSACKKIVDSTVEDRAHLFAEISKLSVTKKSTYWTYMILQCLRVVEIGPHQAILV